MRIKAFFVLVLMMAMTATAYSQRYDYLKAAKDFLELEECEKAQKCYEVYKYINETTDADLEGQIEDCFKTRNLTFTVRGVSFEMVYVKGGTFAMGATDGQTDYVGISRELPVHDVTVNDYYIGQCEVTQALWKAVMGYNSDILFTDDAGRGNDYPAYAVTMDNCLEFLNKLNALTGKSFRLPTEAEWEYAARGGERSNNYKFSGSNDIEAVAWYKKNSDKTHPVGQKDPNELGLYDMSGNVFEWCSDRFRAYDSNAASDQSGSPLDLQYVVRGGGVKSSATRCRVSYRMGAVKASQDMRLGFRIVLEK